MIINKTTGAIYLPESILITAEMTRLDFEASSLGKNSKLFVKNDPWNSFHLPKIVLADKRLNVIVFFEWNRLTRVDIAFNLDLNVTTWADWSYENEMANKKYHDALLEENLGQPPYVFSWGKVISVYDERSEGSEIIITYAAERQ